MASVFFHEAIEEQQPSHSASKDQEHQIQELKLAHREEVLSLKEEISRLKEKQIEMSLNQDKQDFSHSFI